MGINIATTCLLMGLPTVIYTMFGGVQAVTWTDVKQMVVIVFGLVAVLVAADRQPAADRERVRRAAPRRHDRTTADLRLPFRSRQPLHVLVGHDRLALPVHVLLRHGPEPGAALPDRAIGGRGARVAVHERLLEDSAAGARAARRRLRVRVLPVLADADALQHRAPAAGRRPAPEDRSTRSSKPASTTRRRCGSSRPSRWPRRATATMPRRSRSPPLRSPAGTARCGPSGSRP